MSVRLPKPINPVISIGYLWASKFIPSIGQSQLMLRPKFGLTWIGGPISIRRDRLNPGVIESQMDMPV
jgi:hypothetical protein